MDQSKGYYPPQQQGYASPPPMGYAQPGYQQQPQVIYQQAPPQQESSGCGKMCLGCLAGVCICCTLEDCCC